MNRKPLALLGLLTLAISALPTTLAGATDDLGAPGANASVALDGQSTDAVGPPGNPCRPYPANPGPVIYGYCAVKGSERAVAMFLDNATAGNYTTVQEVEEGVQLMEDRILACQNDPGNLTCPALILTDP